MAAATPLGFGVLLMLFCQEQFTARSVCETPTREINHSSAESLQLSYVISSSSCVLHGEVNRVVTQLITRGVVVLRLLGSGLRI